MSAPGDVGDNDPIGPEEDVGSLAVVGEVLGSQLVTGQGSETSVRCDLKTMCKSRKYRSTPISGKDDQ